MPKFELPTLSKLRSVELPKLAAVEVPKPVYAGAGVADLAVATVKGYVDTLAASAQARGIAVAAKVVDYRKQVAGFEAKSFAGGVQSKATARVGSLTAEAKARRTQVEARVNDLQADARALPEKVTSFYKETASEARETYQDLAKRGEVFVARLRGAAAQDGPAAQASGTKASATNSPAEKSSATRASATRASAKKAPATKTSATKTSAKKAPATKTAAKKAPARKAPAAKTAGTQDA